jgi:formyltetrahydrofolate deformylase
MRVLPAGTCWRFAGGRIVNLHHGLLPSFPGPRPYDDAYGHRMLTYGATIHFIVPELDAKRDHMVVRFVLNLEI